jgi:GNAT superfamily N-acetyltransferase
MDAIIELGKSMYVESDYQGMAFNEDKCRAFLSVVITTGLAIIAEKDGYLVGMLGAGLQQHIFTTTFMSCDYLFYVVPGYRGTGVAVRLINVYIAWAQGHGIKRENIYIGINAGINTEKIERFYNKIGFKRSGINLKLQEV